MNKDTVVMISGATGRIGLAISREILSHGAKIIMIDIDEVSLKKISANFDKTRSLELVADVCAPDEVELCIEKGFKKFGRIDAVIHAAYPRSKGWGDCFENLKKENLDQDLSNQLGGAILFSQKILEFFKKQGFGNLIHISSIMGVVSPKFENYAGTGMSSPVEYTAIKAALIATTRYLAKYYKGNNIRVNCISPGGILDKQPVDFVEKYRSCCNDKGMLDEEDIVGTALYLLSDKSRYVTGQNIIVDDGWSL